MNRKIREPFKDVADLTRFTNSAKSSIISLTTNIEHQIETILAKYFTDNQEDYDLFSSLFYNIRTGITFNKKIEMFKKYLNKVYPEFLKENTNFINSLELLQRLRNNFAHSMNPKGEDKEKLIGKVYFELYYIEEGKLQTKQFSFEQMKDRIEDIEKIRNNLILIYKKLNL